MSPPAFHFDKRFLDLITLYHGISSPSAATFGALLRAIVPVFETLHIEYAFTATIAVRLHGAEPLHAGCNVQGLMTPESWETLRSHAPAGLDLREGDRDTVSVSSERYQSSYLLTPDIESLRERIYGAWVVRLPWLIHDLLRLRSAKCRDTVVRLIRANHLSREFETQLPEGYRSRFRRLLNRARSQPPE